MRCSRATVGTVAGSGLATGLVALTVAGGAAAHAAVVVSDTDAWTETYTNTCSYDDIGDVTIVTVRDYEQVYTVKRRAAGTKEYFFDAQTRFHETNTNPETGRSWTVDAVEHEHDTNVLDVDGDVFTVRTVVSSRAVYHDEEGDVFERSSGMARLVLEIDTKGTVDPSDDEGSFLEFDFGHGSPGPDFCEDARAFTVD